MRWPTCASLPCTAASRMWRPFARPSTVCAGSAAAANLPRNPGARSSRSCPRIPREAASAEPSGVATPIYSAAMARNFNPQTAARALARRLAVQALYRWQLNPAPWQELASEFALDADMPRADGEYFRGLLQQAIEQHEQLDLALAPFLDRTAATLDPIEHAVLLIASVELQHRPQLPFRVVIDEAVGLA